MQVREKVGKSQNTAFVQWFVAPEGRKVGSLKRRVRSQLARWEMNNCTPLWCEAHFQVKMYKPTHQLRTTFGSWDVEQVHAVVARSTCRSQIQTNINQHTSSGPLLEVEMSKKCTPLWHEDARSTFRSQNVKNTTCSDHFLRFGCPFAWQAQGIAHLVKSVQNHAKPEGFVAFPKNHGKRGTFEEDLQRCIFRGRRSTKDMFIRDVRRSGRWFPAKAWILEHQIFSFAKMILRDRSSTSYDLASLFVAGAIL